MSSYRMFSLLAVAFTSVLVACAPDDAPLMESAAFSCGAFESGVTPAGPAAPVVRRAVPLT